MFYIYSLHKNIFQADPDPSSPNSFHTRYVYSDDDGLTWSNYVDITEDVKEPTELAVWAGAGRGMQMRNGTLIVPVVVSTTSSPSGLKGAFVHSSDQGATWQRSAGVTVGSIDENTIVELNDGRLMLNARTGLFSARAVSFTSDFGATWTAPVPDNTLIDPTVQGNLIRYTSTLDGYDQDRLLFSNPASTSSRVNNTMRISYDEGQTWAHSKLYRLGGGGYSCLTILDDGKIGVLYEINSSAGLRFKRVTLDDLTDGTDTFVPLNPYCTPSTNPDASLGGITRMRIIDHTGTSSTLLDNASSSIGYDNQSAVGAPNLNIGTTYRVIFNTTNTSTDRKFASFWADFNADGDFDDAGESLLAWSSDSYNSATYQFSSSLSIPVGATTGNTRFRVAFKTENVGGANSGSPTACGTFTNGEVEDYTINIVGAGARMGSALSENGKDLSNDESNIKLFPMPVEGLLSISGLSASDGGARLEIYNLDGQRILEVHTNEPSLKLDVSSLKRGIYLITISDKEGIIRSKLLKN